MNNETCIHGGITPIGLLESLHDSQAGTGRHRCPNCAFERGFILGSRLDWKLYDEYCRSIHDPESCQIGSIAPISSLSDLGENQGGAGRHKCTICAFKLGFEYGLMDFQLDELTLKLVSTPKIVHKNKHRTTITPSTFDYIENEIRNKQLGLKGELFILKNEIKLLEMSRKYDLAKQVKHVSVVEGDGLGFDILSFDLDGNEKKIEVKTTRCDITRQFYLSQNELETSKLESSKYHLYRLFDFDPKMNVGKYYIISGDLSSSLILEPITYRAYPRT